MKLKDMLAQQSAARHALLANGYRPIPLADKVAFMKGWPTMTVDAGAIDGWPTTLKREDTSVPVVTTGVQMTGDLIGVDVDVLDKNAVDELFNLAADTFGDSWLYDVLIRVGKPPKELWLFRTDRPYGMWKTPRYRDAAGTDHMIEVYGGDSVRYFGAIGPHSMERDENDRLIVETGAYKVRHWYTWGDGEDPTNKPVEDLPIVSVELLEEFLWKADDLMAEREGWAPAPRQKAAGSFEASTVYKLTRDMVFDTPEGFMSYEDAAAYAAMDRSASCSASWLDGMPHKNKTRCRLHALGEGSSLDLQAFDFDSFTTYLPLDAAPKSREEREEQLDRVGAALAGLHFGSDLERDLAEADYDQESLELFEAAVEEILSRYARNQQTGCYHELRRAVMDKPVPYKVMVENYCHCEFEYERPNRANPSAEPVTRKLSPMKVARDTWVLNGGMVFDRVGFDPRTEDRLFEEDGAVVLNIWQGLPALPEARDRDVELLDLFLRHLIPTDEERAFFLDWLATKYTAPWERMCGVLFVAPNTSGTGRGAFYEICHELFKGYVGTATEDQLFGKFTGWLDRKVMVTVNEVGSSTRYADKMADYQKLKDLVDPTNTHITAERKFQDSVSVPAYHSVMIATNKLGGIHLDDEDRRFAVISNGGMLDKVTGWADEFMARTRKNRVELAAALAKMLEEREVGTSMQRLCTPPRFAMWHKVVEGGDTEVDEAIKRVVEENPGKRAWTVDRLKGEVRLALTGSRDPRPRDGVASALASLEGERAARFGLWNMGFIKHTDRVTKSRLYCTDPEWYRDLSLADRGSVIDKKPDEYRKDLVKQVGSRK